MALTGTHTTIGKMVLTKMIGIIKTFTEELK